MKAQSKMGFSGLRLVVLLCLGCLYKNVAGQACDDILREETGVITSQNYPGSYPSSSDCTIFVSIPAASSLRVEFNAFATETNYDFLYYGVGQNNDVARAVGSLSGNTLPDPIDFRVGVVWFRFTSDGSIQYDGWSLTYTATIDTTPVPTTVTTVYTTRVPLPSLPPATGEPIIGLSLYCEANGMIAVFDKDATTSNDATDVHLINENCVAQDYGNNQVAIQTDYNKCGTTMVETADHIIFRNSLLFGQPDPSSPIIKDRELNVTLECRIERRRMADSEPVQLIGSTFEFTQVAFGNFSYYLEVFQDETFSVPYDPVDYPVAVTIGRDLFMAGKVETTGEELQLFIDTCWGTPTSDPQDSMNYTIIDSGCAVDESVRFYNSSDTAVQQFSFHAFAFQTEDPLVYLHCEMLVCDLTNPDSRCSQGCLPGADVMEARERDLHFVSSHGLMAVPSSD